MKKLSRKDTGSFGEDAAAAYLAEAGYKLIQRNLRIGRLGEVDIIAARDGYICFIEVKTRTGLNYGSPAEAVTLSKRNTLRRLAVAYLAGSSRWEGSLNIRFDVVEVFVEKNPDGFNVKEINLIMNAF